MDNNSHRSKLIAFTVDHCAEPALWFGPDARLIYVNQAACLALGYQRQELLTMTLHDIDSDFPEQIWPAHWASLRQHHSQIFESHYKTKQGHVFPVEIKANFVEFENREYICAFARDISERKRSENERIRLEAQMREIQKMESLGILAGGIAHDFNNLLMAILGNADLALFSLPPHAQARRNIHEITVASKRAAELCRQMLAYSGKGSIIVKLHDLSTIIGEMPQMLGSCVSKKATLRYEFTPDLPPVKVDENQIQQVIINLVTNASESLGQNKGDIIISTGMTECKCEDLCQSYLDDNLPEGPYVYLQISDTGKGMDPRTCARIFDPFYSTKFVGRGLGLASVLGIVRGHRGSIQVDSQIGRGTTIRVLLPAMEWKENKEKALGDAPGALKANGAVLLIDDDPSIRQVGAEMLKLLGFSVMTAPDGHKGVELFKAYKDTIDLVVLDLTMPELNGSETFNALCHIKNGVRVILSSGYTEQEATQHLNEHKLAGYIQKPYTVTKLRQTLERALVSP